MIQFKDCQEIHGLQVVLNNEIHDVHYISANWNLEPGIFDWERTPFKEIRVNTSNAGSVPPISSRNLELILPMPYVCKSPILVGVQVKLEGQPQWLNINDQVIGNVGVNIKCYNQCGGYRQEGRVQLTFMREGIAVGDVPYRWKDVQKWRLLVVYLKSEVI